MEAWVAADPRDRQHLVGVWQQDRWSNGGASGLLAAASFDGGTNWKISMPEFSSCASPSSGFARASDPWVSIAPDGTVHMMSLSLNGPNNTHAVQAARSRAGGLTWSDPIVLRRDQGADILNDKNSLTADPHDPNYVYAVWDRLTGATSTVASNFRGPTWSPPTDISAIQPVGVSDVKTGVPVRSGALIPSFAVDPVAGGMYSVWQDGRFSGSKREGVAFSRSSDGGLTWTAPVQVNQVPDVQAFLHTVAADSRGRVAVVYYDFRKDTGDQAALLATCWRLISTDGGETWTESAVSEPFDLLAAPLTTCGYFVGDYEGIASAADRFVSFFVASGIVYATGRPAAVDRSLTGHTEVNRYVLRRKIGAARRK